MTTTVPSTVSLLADAPVFLDATADLRDHAPVMTNMISTLALGAASRGGSDADSQWWLVEQGSTVVGAACSTDGSLLTISPMSFSATAALASAVAAHDLGLPGVAGPRTEVLALLVGLDDPREQVVLMDDVVHVLGDLAPACGVEGGARAATLDDVDLLVAWFAQFQLDADVPPRADQLPSVMDRLDRGGMWLWEVDGRPVAMAGHAEVVHGRTEPSRAVARIGPVYTPLEHRRHGYGAAVTSAVAEVLLAARSSVMLYADSHNRTSNGVYERLGFRVTARALEVALR